ncbi:MAG TPA: rRNA pseudouridine synthase [Firmicutes bacterium]|nr:rRNA pseudouridine synthase [Bacillota bacterium]
MTEQTVKLQKYVSDCGLMSRRAAEAAIVRGEFTVNGLPASLGDRVLPSRDVVRYRGRKLHDPGRKWYIMLNKPRGYVTTMADERGRKSVAELVSDLPARVYPVGRLDMDSEGLLLMTNDGEFANRLAHPSFGHRKVYVVTVAGCVGNGEADRLRAMRELDGEPIAPCEVRILERNVNSSRLRIVLTQGKNRQIRRMAERVGLKVTVLRRVAVGCVTLGELEAGRWKELSPQQVRALRGGDRPAPRRRKNTER